MPTLLSSFVAGVIFALGLGLSGMTQADKVIDFLDVAGDWDPSLAFVMVGAIGTHGILRRVIAKGRDTPIFGDRFRLPTLSDVDGQLIGGAALFGVGWAVGGYCPGPGIVSVASLQPEPLVFIAALTTGMLGWRIWTRKETAETSGVEPVAGGLDGLGTK